MTTRDEIYQAIRNADAAGDGESVRKLAEYLQSMEKTEPKPEKPLGQKVIEFAEPTIEALGAVGGGALGLASPIPGGTAIGAGLGYGLSKGGVRAAKQMLGYEPPMNAMGNLTEGAKDVLVGGSLEAGGNIVGRNLGKAWNWASGKLAPADVRASKIAREAAGSDLEAIRAQLKAAPEGYTAGQASTDTYSPAWQALSQRAAGRDPGFYGPGLTPTQSKAATNALADIAGGTTQTQMRSAAEGSVNQLNERLIPTLKIELDAANTAGRLKPKLEGQAERFGQAAANKVQDVRRFTAAGERAGARAASTTTVPGYPTVPGRYTYMGELEKKAEQVAAQAADASLPFGEASKFAQSAADSLAAHGLRPLESKAVIDSVKNAGAKTEFAGNRDVEKVLTRVAEDISQWTNKGGVIDAYALDAIRKNSVNGVIRDLYPTAEKSVQKELAAKMLAKVKPLIVDAIEGAGGTGYGQYLKDYSQGRQVISQSKLGAEAADLFKNNPKKFVELVEGNDPKTVEKIFGPGNYEIVKEMSADAMSKLKGIADVTARSIKSNEQGTAGQEALLRIINSNMMRTKIPWGLSPKTMAMNRALDIAEHKLGTKTMNFIAEGMKSGQSADDLLAKLPAYEQARVFNILRQVQMPGFASGAALGTTNALSMD